MSVLVTSMFVTPATRIRTYSRHDGEQSACFDEHCACDVMLEFGDVTLGVRLHVYGEAALDEIESRIRRARELPIALRRLDQG